jgi:hypothetical protein
VLGGATRWYALDHGCAPVKRIIEFDGQGSSRLELVALIPGEPAVPDEYEEGPPSKFAPAPPPVCDAGCENLQMHFERLDQSYYKYRVPPPPW